MTSVRVVALAATLLAATAALVTGSPVTAAGTDLSMLVGVVAGAALLGLLPVHLELGRHAFTVTLVEVATVVAVALLAPTSAVLALALGEAIACAVHRQRPLKVLYNTAAAAFAAAAAVFTFGALAPGAASAAALADRTAPGAWPALLVATLVATAAAALATCLVLAVAERRPLLSVAATAVPTGAVAGVLAASVGVAGLGLARTHPAAPALLVPAVAAVVVETRRMAGHRADRLRVERLLEASSRSARVGTTIVETLGPLAEEARRLVTGEAALVCAEGPEGWVGVAVDKDSVTRAPAAAVYAAVARASALGPAPASEIDVHTVVPAERTLLGPAARALVIARSTDGATTRVVLVVARELPSDEHARSREDVLAAFAGHASLAAGNALLLEKVGRALQREVELSRQKDDFVAAVSHELRTPLTVLLASLGTMIRFDDRIDAENRRRLLDGCLRHGRRLQRLIEGVLVLAGLERQAGAGAQDIELDALLREVADDVAHDRTREVPVTVQPGIERIRLDAIYLRLLVANLVENAAKYAPDGPIDVLASTAVDGRLSISVVDHGPGIAPADVHRVFERFVQLDQSSTRREGGLGVGLHLCRRLAGAMSGELQLSETPGGGATFTLLLPRSVVITDGSVHFGVGRFRPLPVPADDACAV